MKPNDKAIEAAQAEGKRWQEGLNRPENQIPCWKVLREADDGYDGYDVIAKFNSREERDKALERLRAEAMLTAAFVAQFQSEDYADVIKSLRVMHDSIITDAKEQFSDGIHETMPSKAADALEAVLAERDALKAGNNELREENENLKAANRYGKDWVDNASQDITRLRADLTAVTEERDRLQIMHDEAYISGMKHGWNCCAAGEEERYKNSIENIREQIRRARAALEGVTEPQR